MKRWKYGLWLDNDKEPDKFFMEKVESCFIATTFEDAIFYLANFREDERYEDLFIDFNYNLASSRNGYDFAKYLLSRRIPIGGFAVHSTNPSKCESIHRLLVNHEYDFYIRKSQFYYSNFRE